MRVLPVALAAVGVVGVALLSTPPVRMAVQRAGNAAPVATPAVKPVPAGVAGRVTLVEFASGLSEPLMLAAPPGDDAGRLWVVEKTGTVRVLSAGGKPFGDPVVNLEGEVSLRSEQGLLGLSFHRDFAKNRRFFVNYTDRKGDTRVVEFRASKEPTGAAERVRELLKVDQPYSNHNGGHVVTGPDGRLWIGMGDGGLAGDPKEAGQDPGQRLAKMLRLDPDAERPTPEIALMGLRNPWRYAFDRKTGDLYIGDVGQNRFEEVSVLAAGTTSGNLGWDEREGFACYEPPNGCRSEGLIPPVAVYPTGREGCTVIGGHVYRGKALPALDGVYFYADYCTALVRSFRWKGGTTIADHWDWRPALDPKDRLASISSFGEDAAGELYILSLDGRIWKLVPRS